MGVWGRQKEGKMKEGRMGWEEIRKDGDRNRGESVRVNGVFM